MTAPITSPVRRSVAGFSVTHAAFLDGTTALTETDMVGVRNAGITPDWGSADITGDDTIMTTFNWLNKATMTMETGYVGFDWIAKLTGTTVTVGGTATTARVLFTPAAAGGTGAGDSFDYSGPAATTFTVDGNTVTLNADLTDLAGVVAAVDAALPAGYVVTAAGGTQVQIALAAAGTGSITVGGADMAAVTGSAGYSNVDGANASELSIPFWQEDAGNQPARPALIRMAAVDLMENPVVLDILLYKVKPTIGFTGPQYKTGFNVNVNATVLLSGFDEAGQPIAGKKRCGRLIARTDL